MRRRNHRTYYIMCTRYVENSQWYPDTRFMLPVTKWFMVSGLQGDATKMDFPVWLAGSMEGLHDEGVNNHPITVQYKAGI